MKQDEYISRKMRWLSFWAACAIVFIHSGTMPGMENQAGWCRFVVDFFTQKLTCWAVPLFFTMAGYWFAQGRYDGYGSFLTKKVRALVIPYFGFVLIALLITTPVVMAANVAVHRSILTNTVFVGSVWGCLNDIFAFTLVEPKPLGVMWFIRTLFFIFLLAPVYRLVAKKCVWTFLAFFLFYPGWDIPHFPLWFGAAIWFYLGVFVGFYREGGLARVRAPLAVAIGLLAVGVTLSLIHLPDSFWKLRAGSFLLGWWFLYDHLGRFLPERLPWFVLQTFWLYCTHNIFMIYIRSGLRFICGTSDIVVAILPFACTPMVMVLSLLAAKTMANRLPRVYAVLCGGRG